MLGRQRNVWNTDDDSLKKIISYEELHKHFMSLA